VHSLSQFWTTLVSRDEDMIEGKGGDRYACSRASEESLDFCPLESRECSCTLDRLII